MIRMATTSLQCTDSIVPEVVDRIDRVPDHRNREKVPMPCNRSGAFQPGCEEYVQRNGGNAKLRPRPPCREPSTHSSSAQPSPRLRWRSPLFRQLSRWHHSSNMRAVKLITGWRMTSLGKQVGSSRIRGIPSKMLGFLIPALSQHLLYSALSRGPDYQLGSRRYSVGFGG